MRVNKYCSQELVNLLTMGKASSNVFDGTLNMDGNTLKGIANRGTVGLLTLMEKMGYCQVGNNLKSPVYPVSIFINISVMILFDETKDLDFVFRESLLITICNTESSCTKV